MYAKIVHYVHIVNGQLVAMQKARCQLPPSKPRTTKNDSHTHALKHTYIAVVPRVRAPIHSVLDLDDNGCHVVAPETLVGTWMRGQAMVEQVC